MSFPALNIESNEQILNTDPYSTRGGKRFQSYLDRTFTISFKTYEGYINYWVMFDLFMEYYALENNNTFLPDVNLTFLDHTGFELLTINFNEIVMTSLGELELNYSSTTAEFKTFTAGFKYNFIDIQKRLSE